jgi:hypothetical protein
MSYYYKKSILCLEVLIAPLKAHIDYTRYKKKLVIYAFDHAVSNDYTLSQCLDWRMGWYRGIGNISP